MNNQEKIERVIATTNEEKTSEPSTSLTSFSSLFIYRPVATTLLMCAIMIAGILGYRYLPVAPLPQVDYPTIQVTTYYPGANPDLMATAITAPLERQLGQVSGLSQMYSQNGYGISVITLQFDLALSMAIAEQEVQAAMNAASQLLPKDLPYPPIYNKVNPADPPILTIAITSSTLPMTRVADLVQNRLIHQIAQVNGIGLVSQSGGQRPAIRVIYNQEALASYQIDSEMIRNAIARASVNTAKGSFDGPERSVTLSANDQLTTPEAYRDIIIKYNKDNQGIVRLGDVAEVVEGAENKYLGAWSDGIPAIILNVHRQPGANVIETVDKIKALLPELIETLPTSLNVEILMDRTVSIRASIHDVQVELFFAIGLVILVIYLFLRDIRATLIASIAVPLSLVGTFAVIYLLGYSINNLTLMALTIATGFVVDDAIVVIENISRYLASKKGDAELKAALGQSLDDEEGLTPFHAALVGAKEIGFTIISLTLSLVAVLIPLLFMGEIVGRLFHEFAVTLAIAILISGVISLTLTPMLCAKLLKSTHKVTERGINAKIANGFNYLIALYGASLKRVLNHPKKMLLLIIGTLIITLALYIYIPKGFFPLQDNSLIQGTVIASQSSSFQQMSHLQTEITQRLETHDSIERVTTFVGIDNTNMTLNSLQVQLVLTPLSTRTATINEVMADIDQLLADIPDVQIFLQPQQDLTIDTQRTRTPYRFTLSVRDIEQLNQWISAIETQLGQLPELQHLSHDWQNQGSELLITVNRDIASRLGISMSAIHESLYNAFGQRQVSTLYTHTNQYRIVLEGIGLSHLIESNGLTPKDILSTHYLTGGNGQRVPLSALATLEEKNTFLSINRLAQFPVVTFYFDVNDEAGYALENAIESINTAINGLNLPKDMNIEFQGASLAFNAALTNTVFLLIAAIITMYIVLGILYESFIHPVTILSTLPTAAIGALLALILLNKDFDMIAVIGVILLIGIVKKNAIMMIDFALVAKREQGFHAKEAITQACLLRFRPILMTTMAAVLGAIPLMLGQGVGSELRQPLGITLVGGLLLSQLLTLYTTPIIYLFFDKLTQTHLSDERLGR